MFNIYTKTFLCVLALQALAPLASAQNGVSKESFDEIKKKSAFVDINADQTNGSGISHLLEYRSERSTGEDIKNTKNILLASQEFNVLSNQVMLLIEKISTKLDEKPDLGKPVFPISDVTNWFAKSVTQALSYDFVNYRAEMGASSDNFTSDGWKSFKNALAGSGNLQTVIDRKYITTSVVTGAPVVLTSQPINNVWTWKIQMPMLVVYQNSQEKTSQQAIVTGVISSVVKDDKRSFAINQLIVE